jgi:hypothetical protein
MSTILQDKTAFEPELAARLAGAVDDTCNALHIPSDDLHDREVIAARIADLARMGMLDPAKLRDRILKEAKRAI